MAINPEDVKLYESQVLSDEDDGGGRATGIEIQDGQVNNLFPDISRLDRTLGDVALRKAFLGIATDNADVYLGAHAIIVEPPADPNVSVVMFDAGSEDDERLQAQNRIESYVVRGSRALFELLGNQYEGQRQLACVAPVDRQVPSAGDVFLLKRQDDSEEQYVRVTSVEHEILTFSYQASSTTFVDFEARRITLKISAPLAATFYGGEPTPAGTTENASTGEPKSEVFTTEVADAARYWGVTRANAEVAPGDLEVSVDAVRASLVPSAQTEQSLPDQVIGLDMRLVKRGADSTYTTSLTATYTSGTELQVFLPRAAIRGTVALTLGGSAYTDDGSGILARASGSFPFSELEIDYVTGRIVGTRDAGTGGGDVGGSVTFQCGAPFTGRLNSYDYTVTLGNRSYNYNYSFPNAKPRPGTTVVAYMVQGRWYELRDPGNGVLEGNGSGTVNFATGTTSVTLQELPDVGSAIIFSYAEDIFEELETHEGTYVDMIPAVKMQLQEGIDPNSLTITYTADSTTKTVTDAGDGTLTGDGSGQVFYATGEVRLVPTHLPDDGTDITAGYDHTTGTETVAGPPVVSNEITDTLPDAPIAPGTVNVRTQIKNGGGSVNSYYNVLVQDDGAGGWEGGWSGSINYATGEYTLQIGKPYTRTYYRFETSYVEA